MRFMPKPQAAFRIAGRGDQGREPVEPRHQAVLNRARRGAARSADDGRHTHATLHRGALAGGEGRVAAVRPGEVLDAVVGGEDDDGALVSSPRCRRCSITAPMLSSTCGTAASLLYQPLSGVILAWYPGDRCATTCTRVGFIQAKKGLLAATAWSMEPIVRSRITSSKVSIAYWV